MKKFSKLAVAAVALLAVTACGKPDPEPVNPGKSIPAGTDTGDITKDVATRTNFDSVYDHIGSKLHIGLVEENAKGMAFATIDGVKYELGMDTLSMAMVYNTQIPEGSTKFATRDDVYNEWWRLYQQRWNYEMLEIPLYSNQYFDVYRKKLGNFRTTAFRSAADAINSTSSTDGSVILGNGTQLGFAFRNPSWGKNSPAASDSDVNSLTSGYATVMTDEFGAYQWNVWDSAKGYGVLESIPDLETKNSDGTITITLRIHQGLKFSDDSEVKAVNYIAGLLANSTAVGVEAGGSGQSGMQLVGFKDFSENADKGTAFKGVKLLDDYTFSLTYGAEYADYHFKIALAGASPDPLALYLGTTTDAIKTNADKECYLDSAFFAKGTDGKYLRAAEIKANMDDVTTLPYSGPFKVSAIDKNALTATLVRNEKYPGDFIRGKADPDHPINNITYIRIVESTQIQLFQSGGVDVLSAITGGEETRAALALVSETDASKPALENHYDRAGYGKLGFRCDFGPSMFGSVRRAIAYSIDRPAFADTFTGGYGTVVDGPYYSAMPAYQATKTKLKINSYLNSAANAKAELVADGWIWDKDGKEYSGTGPRYRKLSGYEKTSANLNFKSLDGKYQTVFVNGNWLMPLCVNWIGTDNNPVTTQLETDWKGLASATTEIGMVIQETVLDFISALYGELLLIPAYGFDGNQKLCAVNFATGFNNAAYDYSYGYTIDPSMYDDYSQYYFMDEADFLSNYVNA